MDQESQEKLMSRVMRALKEDYLLIGTTHVKAWHAWLITGLFVGAMVGVVLVANRSGKVEGGSAQTATLPSYDIAPLPPRLGTESPLMPQFFFGQPAA